MSPSNLTLIALLVAVLTIIPTQGSSSPEPVTLLNAQQCGYAYDVYKNVTTGFVLVACANSGVFTVAPNGTISMVLSQDACWSPTSLREDPVNGRVYVICRPTIQPSPTDGTSFALSGPDFSQVSVVTTGAQCDWVNDIAWDSATDSLIFGCLGTQSGLYRLSTSGNLTLLVDDDTCGSPASFAFVSSLLYLSCTPGPLPAIHMGVYNLETSTFTPLGGDYFCFISARLIVKNTSPVTLLAACLGGPIINVTLFAGGLTIANLTNSTECDSPDGLFLSSSRTFLYASCLAGGVISIDLQSLVVASLLTSDQCPQPSSVFVDETSDLLYAACTNGGLLSLDMSTTSHSSVAEM